MKYTYLLLLILFLTSCNFPPIQESIDIEFVQNIDNCKLYKIWYRGAGRSYFITTCEYKK